MVVCPACGEDLRDGARACSFCRQPLPRRLRPRPSVARLAAVVAHPVIALRIGGTDERAAVLVTYASAAWYLGVRFLRHLGW
jgi:hypothetical protein